MGRGLGLGSVRFDLDSVRFGLGSVWVRFQMDFDLNGFSDVLAFARLLFVVFES